MKQPRENPAPRRLPLMAAWPVLLAVVMGLPALGGGFVGGDDHRLVLNHVLVNRPSFEHAVQLFTIPHRDLYQPLPLLTFSVEFAVAGALGLFADDASGQSGAWLFHLTNILLHAINTLLVFLLVRLLARGTWASGPAERMAMLAAVLFAVHPLQGEVVAWVNGRMMLLSTLFALAAALALAAWLDAGGDAAGRDGPGHTGRGPVPRVVTRRPLLAAGLTVLFVLLSAVSKIRVEMPILLGIVALAGGRRLDRRFWVVWAPCAIVTGVFTWINIQTTADARLFEGGAEQLTGPRAVRVLVALAFYVQKFFVPVGLCSYYPTMPSVAWADPATLRAAAILLPALAAVGFACLRSPGARLATLWFGAALAPTLPFFPARNVLAADRYMYLPMVGALWLVAQLAVSWRRQRTADEGDGGTTTVLSAGGRGAVLIRGVVVALLVGLSWHNVGFYNTPLAKTLRVAALYPDTPRVWNPVGFVYLEEGEKALAAGRGEDAAACFREAMAAAERELRHDDARVRGDAYQLIGMTHLRAGRVEEALASLGRAIETDGRSSQARFRLASALDELGRPAEALRYYRETIDIAPEHNAALVRLARLSRESGDGEAARRAYEQAIVNNAYEVSALLGLSELDIESGEAARIEAAAARLTRLLEWMPDNVDARVNLGVALASLGRYDEAAGMYESALGLDAGHPKATLNLALLYQSRGDPRGDSLFLQAAGLGWSSFAEAAAVDDGLLLGGQVEPCVTLWARFAAEHAGDVNAEALLAWSLDLAGRSPEAVVRFRSLAGVAGGSPYVAGAAVQLALLGQDHEGLVRQTKALCAAGPGGAGARRRLLYSLELSEARRSDRFWTYLVAAYVLKAEGNTAGAAQFTGRCEAACVEGVDAPCRRYLDELKAAP